MKRVNEETHSPYPRHAKKPKNEREFPHIDKQSFVHPKDLKPSMFQSRSCDLAVKAKALRISAGSDLSTIIHCISPSTGLSRPVKFWVCILGVLPAGQFLQPTTSRFSICLKLMGARYVTSSSPPWPISGEPMPADVDDPLFKLIYDDAIQLQLTSNKDDKTDIVRPGPGACGHIAISRCLYSLC